MKKLLPVLVCDFFLVFNLDLISFSVEPDLMQTSFNGQFVLHSLCHHCAKIVKNFFSKLISGSKKLTGTLIQRINNRIFKPDKHKSHCVFETRLSISRLSCIYFPLGTPNFLAYEWINISNCSPVMFSIVRDSYLRSIFTCFWFPTT